jgi:ABC-type transporter Mla subunit MlaD
MSMNGQQLRDALEGARPQLEEALAQAETELERLDARRAKLIELIGRARAALGVTGRSTSADTKDVRPLTLHEALAQILREQDNAWMTARALTAEVNARGLYKKRDGSPVEANQVHARTKNYAHLFEKDGSQIRLREG